MHFKCTLQKYLFQFFLIFLFLWSKVALILIMSINESGKNGKASSTNHPFQLKQNIINWQRLLIKYRITCTLWIKQPLVTLWLPIVLIACSTYSSGLGDTKLTGTPANFVETKNGQSDCTIIPFDLYSIANALFWIKK